MTKKLQPALRFRGFTDAWEQRKLGDVAIFSKGSGYSKNDLRKSGTPIILYGRLYTKYKVVIDNVDTFTTEKPNSVFSHGGEVIVPASGETAEDISIASVIEKPRILIGGDINIIDPPNNIDAIFLAISISNGKTRKAMAKLAQGVSIVHLHNNDLRKIIVNFPSNNEQKQITNFLNTLDNLIAATERKKELLQKKKQAYLQLIFSQHLRFKGFTKPWRQTQISDIFHERRERNPEGELLSISVANGVQVSTLSNNSMQDLSKYKVVVKNDLAYNSMRMWQGASGASLYNGIVSPAYTVLVPQKDVNSQFYAYLFKTTKMLYIFRSFSQGMTSDTWNLKYPTLSKINVLKPSLIEQNQIAELFKTLDELIKANDKKLELLKKKKKAYLQKMFI